ncbi:MAG: DUF3450 family protein [Opitutales bacterium]|nr:DUF3450 family protein [Opitutales bacterium]
MKNGRFALWTAAAAVVTVVYAAPLPARAIDLDETTSTLKEWVQTERIISRERADWEVERSTLRDLIAVYADELEQLEEMITRAEEDTTAVDARRAELTDRLDGLREVQSVLRDQITAEEARVRELVRYFPEPLRKELQPLINRLPRPGREVEMGLSQRMQNVVGILTQADNFNRTVTIETELRETDAGSIAVTTMYFGLGIAYFIDGSGQHAGYGVPAADDWSWTSDPEYTPVVQQLFNVYRRNVLATYVNTPIETTDIQR